MLHESPKVFAFNDEAFVTSRTKLRERFLKLYDEPFIIIDLRGLHLVEASLLAELAQLRVHRHAFGLRIGRLVIDSHYVRNALSAVGFERNWPIYKTLEDAVLSFDGPEPHA